MRRDRLTTILLTVGATLLVLALGALAFIYSGVYNIAATDPHIGVIRWALNTTQVRSVKARGDDVPAPPPIDSALLAHGFSHFDAMCVVCHGAPGLERGEFGRGMNPRPPSLSDMAELYSSRELFRVVKHGLKMAGMPAFGPTHSDEEIWGIVAFVEQLPRLTPEEYQRRRDERAAADGGAAAAAGGHTHRPGAAPRSH